MAGERDCSIWVGDLTPDVDDLQLYKFFADRFNTVRTAKGNPFNFTNYFIHIVFYYEDILHNLLNCTKQPPSGFNPTRYPLPSRQKLGIILAGAKYRKYPDLRV